MGECMLTLTQRRRGGGKIKATLKYINNSVARGAYVVFAGTEYHANSADESFECVAGDTLRFHITSNSSSYAGRVIVNGVNYASYRRGDDYKGWREFDWTVPKCKTIEMNREAPGNAASSIYVTTG